MRAVLIVNPRSGTMARLADPIPTLESAARAAGFELVLPPASVDELEMALKAGLADGAEAALVAGGDGTQTAAARILAGTPCALGIIPGGTMNRLAARLGLPADPVAAVAALGSATPVPMDAASVSGRLFLYQCVVGRAARLARFREMQRDSGWRGWWRLVRAGLRALFRLRYGRLALVGGDPPRRLRTPLVVVTVPPPGSGGAQLQVEAVRRLSIWRGFRQGLRWLRGRLRDDPDVDSFPAGLLVLGGPRRLRMMLDGEQLLLPRPLRIRFRPAALTVLAPSPPPAP